LAEGTFFSTSFFKSFWNGEEKPGGLYARVEAFYFFGRRLSRAAKPKPAQLPANGSAQDHARQAGQVGSKPANQVTAGIM
jgi:hypothetical protein